MQGDSKKKITLIGLNYSPEDTAIGIYSTQMADFLIEEGYDVSVITGFPYYPQWKIREDYKKLGLYFKEVINGVSVFRFKQFVPSNPTFSNRILHILSFTIGSFWNLFKVPRPDIVIVIVPFTSSMFLGWILKSIYGSRLWVHIQDFEFDAAVDSGLLNNNKAFLIKGLIWIEKVLLKRAKIVSTISKGMLSKLETKTGINGYYLTNWTDLCMFENDSSELHEYLKSAKFKILYSGNIGSKQDWQFFSSFVEALREANDVEVIVVGNGAEKHKVLKITEEYSFVKHFDLVPYKDLSWLLTSADLHILFQKENVIDTVMPSKLLGMMASARPSIITGNLNSEVAEVMKASKGGYYFEPSELDNVIESINDLKSNPELSKQIGQQARGFVFNEYAKDKVLTKFGMKIKEILSN